MAEPNRAPAGINTNVPSVARVYDYFLGGKDNFAVDREVVEQVAKLMPAGWNPGTGAQDNRAFLRRTVRHLTREAGIRQFIDIGSGLPTQGNVHEVAQEAAPSARVVYVDNDPIVLVHARALLGRDPGTAVITADVRDPDEIVGNPAIRDFIDFKQPVGLLMLAILHHINDHENPGGITRRLTDAMPDGSHLVISHFRNPGAARPDDADLADRCERLFNDRLGAGRWRTQQEITAYFGDWKLLDPGLVPLPEWRPDPGERIEEHPVYHLFVGGVARKN
ncbi:SAM-dependent methyltransferase [Spongiactinospora sp. TRM90649]|uniref:SAM-dependent methyltransferase n=1 Tax=Spongiactinospora sp. TRM90649 TaxID=3031114 RepID=UPI0023F9C606|nr:SAM-dependent methyltransferase [Spongiactinospora sp. TRM90649]MDF5754178.1 SAM-dependent methyltransferase [Spongiactinospora sp. TRM90649]